MISGGKIDIDLSFLNLNKGSNIRVKGDSDNFKNWTPIKTFATQNKKETIKFAIKEKDGTLDIATSFTLKSGAFNPADYQFKTLYGTDWLNMESNFDIDTTTIAGTTLMIRKGPVQSSLTDGNFAGTEVKVKIPAAPKTPKVKVDYKNATLDIPASAEYKILYTVTASAITTTGSSITHETAWSTKTSGKEKLSPSKILEKFDKDTQLQAEKDNLLTNGFILAVRTAIDSDKKKAASNIAFITVGSATKADISNKTVTV